MKVAIIGGGICGLSLALNLHSRGIEARIYERVPEIKPLGVGITLLPHAMREFSALGLGERLLAAGIENRESHFYNRFGQLIYREDRGKFAGGFTAPFFQRANHIICESFPPSMDEFFKAGLAKSRKRVIGKSRKP